MSCKSPVIFVCLKPSIFWENCIKLTFLGCPRKFYHRVTGMYMYIAPSSGNISLNFNMPFKLILRRFEVVFWCLEWEIENGVLFERLMEIHSYLPIIYYDSQAKIFKNLKIPRSLPVTPPHPSYFVFFFLSSRMCVFFVCFFDNFSIWHELHKI